ncbi:hypothetical protein LCGC14_0392550 [marine sediment metagenome]|uniref:Uncharacterized protein n=1 Tax=marine sediment metagenome TaxID=412755 RepID=A0A0F9VLG9_9ZZZZ
MQNSLPVGNIMSMKDTWTTTELPNGRTLLDGPMDEFTDALDHCQKEGHHTVRAGPKPVGSKAADPLAQEFDPDQFRIIFERNDCEDATATKKDCG